MADFDVDKYRASLRQKIDKAYDAYDVVFASNIGPNSRPVVTECLDDYISSLNRKLFNSFTYGEKSNVPASDTGTF